MTRNIETIIKDPVLIEKKRKTIIKAANKLFVKSGFHKTSISQIAKESGLTTGTLYNYIRQKEDILFLLHEEIQKKVIHQINLGIQQGTDIPTKVERVFQNVLDLINKYQKTCRLIFLETASQTKVSLQVLLSREYEIIEQFEDIIADGVREKVFNVQNPRIAASIIHYLIFYQSLSNWDIKKTGLSDSETKEEVLVAIYRILGFDHPV